MALGHWAKKYLGGGSGGSGGGGNANVLIVHGTVEGGDNSIVTLDKTYAEIDAAISAGALVFVDVSGLEAMPGSARLTFMNKAPAGFKDMPSALYFSATVTGSGMALNCATLTVAADGEIYLFTYNG